MPLKKQLFPLRIPVERLAEVYNSVEEAFEKHDYIYVARFALDNPELRGCALLMLGNRAGGELILDRHNIKTALSFLYRAFAAWRAEDLREAERWIAEGKAANGTDHLLDRLSILMARKSFSIVMHSRGLMFGHVKNLEDLPEIDLILTSHTPPSASNVKMLPMGDSLAGMIPQGKEIDLVIVYDPWAVPPGAGDLGAPVVFVINDGESAYDALGEVIHEADWVATQGTSEMVECGKTYGVDCFTQYYFFPAQIDACDIYKRMNDRTGRDIDLLFTGGLTQDFYRDKRQRIIPLAYEIDPQFKIILYEGILQKETYWEMLKKARFAPVSTRFSNDLSSRSLDLLAHGVINLIHEDSAMPFLFSERFACFQTYEGGQAHEDMIKHLYRYDTIQDELKSQLPRLEAELRDLLIPNHLRARRFLRDFLFMTHVIKPKSKSKRGDTPKRNTVPFNQLHLASYPREQLDRLIKLSRPQNSGRAADWLRLALAAAAQSFAKQKDIISIIEEGLTHHPKSVSLLYAHALLLRNAGEYEGADKIFDRIATSKDLITAPEDPFPSTWEPLQGFYWIADAKIRARSPVKLLPEILEANVWKSFALSHRADIALKDIPIFTDQHGDTKERFRHIIDLAQQAIAHLPHNDAAQRAYLRAVYGLFALGDVASGENFLQSFEAAIYIDGRLFNDFAAMAVDILSLTNRLAEAQRIIDKLDLFLDRVYFGRTLFFLYPEILPLLVRYELPHGNLLRR